MKKLVLGSIRFYQKNLSFDFDLPSQSQTEKAIKNQTSPPWRGTASACCAVVYSGLLKLLFLTDKACRFTPTCSEYTYQAISKYGIILGGWKGLKRILRCNPLNSGGNNPLG